MRMTSSSTDLNVVGMAMTGEITAVCGGGVRVCVCMYVCVCDPVPYTRWGSIHSVYVCM